MKTESHGLKRELRLRDLVMLQVTLIFSLTWTGYAAKQGASQMVLWLLAILLFYLPLAAAVMKLSRAMPMEGGVYQWVKAAVSPFAGFMAGWNITIYFITAFAVIGSQLANGFADAAGPGGAWMASSKWFTLTLTAAACAITLLVNIRGLHFAKWLSGACSILWAGISVVLLYLLIKAWVRGLPGARSSLSFAWPGVSAGSLNVMAKMAIGALAGFDSCAIFSAECRKPENDVARSVVIAAPLIAAMYIAATAAVLAYTAPANVDLAASVPQLLQAGFGKTGLGVWLTLVVILGFQLALIAGMVMCIGMVARLPMVAGWDGLLPAWWSELHPEFRTPYKAVAAATGALMVLGALTVWGSGNQEAVQVAAGAGIAALCVMYMLLFSVILVGFAGFTRGPGLWLAALTAFSVALISLVFQFAPLGDVKDRLAFGVKVAVTFCGANALGALLYWRGKSRLTRLAAGQSV